MSRIYHICAAAVAAIAPISASLAEQTAPAWQPIFNGRDLRGWTPKINHQPLGRDPNRTFRASNGVLSVSYEGYRSFSDEFGHLFYKVPFSRYRLRLDYRFVGENMPGAPTFAFRNSGVMIHAQEPHTMGADQPFPVSFEVQFLKGDGKTPRPTGNICTPGTVAAIEGIRMTEHCRNAHGPTISDDRWVHVEVQVDGADSVRTFIDGKEVLTYTNLELDRTDLRAMELFLRDPARSTILGRGYIALQAEAHPIEFKNIAILDLSGSKA